VLPRDYLKAAWEFTRQRNLALHVDGARIFNAVVEYGCELTRYRPILRLVHHLPLKGLGAPVGSLLVGSEDTSPRQPLA
jgi:threonine aldolase